MMSETPTKGKKWVIDTLKAADNGMWAKGQLTAKWALNGERCYCALGYLLLQCGATHDEMEHADFNHGIENLEYGIQPLVEKYIPYLTDSWNTITEWNDSGMDYQEIAEELEQSDVWEV